MWVLFLILAWAAALASSVHLCRVAVEAARAPVPGPPGGTDGRRVSIYETAFLAGGPRRVADLTLVSMSRQRRLLLAHTGWATVVDPVGRDDLERSVITLIGPGGQSRTAAVRAALAAAEAVRGLADRLAAAGLAVPAAARSSVTGALRQAQATALLVVLAGAVALLVVPGEGPQGPVAAWFALPLVFLTGSLTVARMEVHPYTRWASPAGRRLLGRIVTPAEQGGGGDDDPAVLTAFAVYGRAALADPALRAALPDGPLRGAG